MLYLANHLRPEDLQMLQQPSVKTTTQRTPANQAVAVPMPPVVVSRRPRDAIQATKRLQAVMEAVA